MVDQQELSLDPGFIEDVGKKLADTKTDNVNDLINQLNLRYQHIRAAENQVLQSRQRLHQKLQYLKQTLACVDMLLERRDADEDTIIDYCLAANIFAKAKVQPTKAVNLWLGADVMLEYPIEEAKEVLETNLSKCESSLTENKDTWDKVKDCKTTVEVNIARCHNFDVERKKASKAPDA